jgi:hypothetical protein
MDYAQGHLSLMSLLLCLHLEFGGGTEAQPQVILKKPHSLRFSSLSSLISVRSNDRLYESEGFRYSAEAVVSF